MIPLTQTAQALYGTVTPTQTVVPTETPFVAGSLLTCRDGSSAGITCTQIDPLTVKFTSDGTAYNQVFNMNFDVLSDATLYIRVESISEGLIYAHYGQAACSNAQPFNLRTSGGITLSSLGARHDYVNWNTAYERVETGIYDYSYFETESGNDNLSIWGWAAVCTGANNVQMGNGSSVTLSSSPIFSQPTPVPTPSGYCATIQGTDALGIDSEFALPVPHLGAKTCPVNYDGLDIPLFALLGLPDVRIPAIQICFQDITFGTLKYYGMDMDIDYLAYILAAALIVAMFTRGR